MEDNAPQVPSPQEVTPTVNNPQVPQQPPVKQSPPEGPEKEPKTKKFVMFLILFPVLAIGAYGIFLAVTYWNCSNITPKACEVNTKCNFSLSGFYFTSEIQDNCCGNTLCEEGYETNSDCPTDCPNCDDNSGLTVDSFNYKTQQCENIVTHYFIDDIRKFVKTAGSLGIKGIVFKNVSQLKNELKDFGVSF